MKDDVRDRPIITPARADTVPKSDSKMDEATGGNGDFCDRTSCGVLQPAASLPTSGLACWGEEFSRTCSPVGAQHTFGGIHVRVIAVIQKASYTERKLLLKVIPSFPFY